jgi:hypothetical protein
MKNVKNFIEHRVPFFILLVISVAFAQFFVMLVGVIFQG